MSATRSGPDATFIVLLFVLAIFGLVVLSSASVVASYDRYGDSNAMANKQLQAFLLGTVLFIFLSRLDYRKLQRFVLPAMVINLILLVMVFLPGVGSELLGAKRWIAIGPVFFQPSELMKLTFVLYLAMWLSRRHEPGVSRDSFFAFLTILTAVALLLALEPDVGTMTVIAFTGVAMYFTAGAPFKHFLWLLLAVPIAYGLLITLAPYRVDRLTTFLRPELDPQGIGYHINQALLAIGSGGLFGRGFGHSIQKYNFLPEAAGDSIFAVMAEELGFLLTAAFLAVLFAFLLRGLRIAQSAPDRFGQLLVVGIVAWIGIQSTVNIAALTGILPLTGIPLPFMSNGGSALISLLLACGIVVSVSRFGRNSVAGVSSAKGR